MYPICFFFSTKISFQLDISFLQRNDKNIYCKNLLKHEDEKDKGERKERRETEQHKLKMNIADWTMYVDENICRFSWKDNNKKTWMMFQSTSYSTKYLFYKTFCFELVSQTTNNLLFSKELFLMNLSNDFWICWTCYWWIFHFHLQITLTNPQKAEHVQSRFRDT